MTKKYYLCVDAGGTTSKVAIIDENGHLLQKEIGKAGSPAVSPDWYLHIDETITKILQNFSYPVTTIAMGISGISALNDTIKEQKYFEEKYHTKCLMTSDTMTCLYAILDHPDENGIVVIAGTGVAVFAKNKDQTYLVGGWGHLLRERGSAYAIVHDFCVNIIDKTEEKRCLTPLEKAFLQENKIGSVRNLNHLFYQHSKGEIASLSNFFKRYAKKGNGEAILLLRKEGEKLAKQVIDIINLLDLKDKTKIGLSGGFLEIDGEEIIKGLKEYLEKNHINLNYYDQKIDQIQGVFKYALLGGE